MTIGEEVLIHGYIDEIRKDIVIIRNEGGYFGTVPEEIRSRSEIPNTCGDVISRAKVYEMLRIWLEPDDADRMILRLDDEIPSVTPQQRTGRWIQKEEEGEAEPFIIWECSECNEAQKRRTKFCPFCGIKMEVEE